MQRCKYAKKKLCEVKLDVSTIDDDRDLVSSAPISSASDPLRLCDFAR
jgi:hypothetical protein